MLCDSSQLDQPILHLVQNCTMMAPKKTRVWKIKALETVGAEVQVQLASVKNESMEISRTECAYLEIRKQENLSMVKRHGTYGMKNGICESVKSEHGWQAWILRVYSLIKYW